MYLKSIELVGFKSFVNPTKLNFEPGMAAIIGPNGCGKSNVVDAIRWVLGEQSAKTLRGTKQEDFIFNGTDSRKALGMAEVSITFANCEAALEIDYNEVTITRRVYRSGEGEYMLNRTTCRLRDIHRMFMNTGIGRSSYSIMEQGRIDQILSSRPEDRRAVFEEASGITKYKADKKEAIRKLEQTEANLLRLADVIREVKRQIGSLQRQAGKARRYKSLREELRSLDIYLTRKRLTSADDELTKITSQLTSFTNQLDAAHADVDSMEKQNTDLRRSMAQTEHEIDTLMQGHNDAVMELNRSRDTIKMNTERVSEIERMSAQEQEEIKRTAEHIDHQREQVEQMATQLNEAKDLSLSADKKRQEKIDILSLHQQETAELKNKLEELTAEFMGLETSLSHLQNELVEMDAGNRQQIIRRERLAAECKDTVKQVAEYEENSAELQQLLEGLRKETDSHRQKVTDLSDKHTEAAVSIASSQSKQARLESSIAACNAQIEMLTEEKPAGTQLLLDESNPLDIDRSKILGSLREHLTAEQEYRTPLEAYLRTWLDAIVVKDMGAATSVLNKLETRKEGSVKLVIADNGSQGDSAAITGAKGEQMINHVTCADSVKPLAAQLLSNVFVVESIDDVPSPIPARAAYVTREGSVLRGDGAIEFWDVSHLRNDLAALHKELELETSALESLTSIKSDIAKAIEAAREELDTHRHGQAVKEGELDVVSREVKQAKDRLETVTWELQELDKKASPGTERRDGITKQMDEITQRREALKKEQNEHSHDLKKREDEHASLSSDAMEARVRCSESGQRAEILQRQLEPMRNRLVELETMAKSRAAGIVSRESTIKTLKDQVEQATSEIGTMEAKVNQTSERLKEVRETRSKAEERLAACSLELTQKRSVSDALRENKASLDVKYAEAKMRRQNTVDRVTSEYSVTLDDLKDEPDPDWNEAKPEDEWIDTRVAELRTKLDGMGPVNLVAIDEYQELEERYEFLNQQSDDLANARRKLLEMISHINKTTSELFSDTFAKVNENFGSMFRQLFNGGSAKLVLVDEEDVLESGIEIIARPPGKKLQNVSLLSGGERTMTAVSLLFAIYMVRPSPFCVLDELDAPLDDSNIGRFITILQGFLDQSQFLVITHNQKTISAADVLYGVTMEEKGVSKIVSMRFPEQKISEDAQETTQDEPETATAN